MFPAEELHDFGPDLEVVRLIGCGGMGAVYEGRQKSLDRIVAIKVLPVELTDESGFVEHFERESRALAALDHVNLARVFDAGISEAGQPYFVMEFIQGMQLTRYWVQHRLSLRARLEILLQVCAGVLHAHQKGIVHRDIKPSNILVTAQEGRPLVKVIDFGLARTVNDVFREQAYFGRQYLLGTPAYMSPEQRDLDAGGADTRSDVYQLGVLLYEALVGRTFRDPNSETAVSADSLAGRPKICEGPNPSQALALQPNTTAEPPIRCAQVRGELDWINARALAEKRENRYQSVGELADDLRRFLSGEAVSVAPSNKAYRWRKVAQRHWVGLVLVAGVFLALTALTALSLLEARSALQAQRATRAQFVQGEQLIGFLLDDLYFKLEPVGRLNTLEATLDHVGLFYSNQPPSLLSEVSRRNQAVTCLRLGIIAHDRGQNELAKTNLLTAIDRFEQLILEQPAQLALRNDLSLAYNNLAIMYHEGALAKGEDPEPLYRKAIALKDPLADQAAGNPQFEEGGAAYAYNLSMWLQGRGRFEQAAELQRQIEARYLKLASAQPEETRWQDRLATVWQGMAFIQERLTNYAAARVANQKAITTIERLLPRDPANLALQSRLAELQNNLGNVLAKNGELEKAEATFRQAVQLRESMIRKDPENAQWRSLLATSWNNLASVLDEEGRHEESSEARVKGQAVQAPLSAGKTAP